MRLAVIFALGLACAMNMQAIARPLPMPTCKTTLDQALAGADLTRAQFVRLGSQRGDEACKVARSHFVEMVKARAVTAVCKTGSDRDRDLQKLDEAVEGINGVIAERCGI